MSLHKLLRIVPETIFNPDDPNIASDLRLMDRQVKGVFDRYCPESFRGDPRLMQICRYALNPKAFYTLITPPTENATSRNIFHDPETGLQISECNCTDSAYQEEPATYDRLSSSRRADIESAFLEKFIASHPDKNQPIRIACLGSAFMADTNLLIARLVFRGYTDLEFYCIDPIYAHNLLARNCFEQVAKTYYDLPNISVKLYGRINVENLPEMDAFVAIDFDGFFESFPKDTATVSLLTIAKVTSVLRKNGIGVLGIKFYGDLFFPNIGETPSKWNMQGVAAIYEDMRKNLPDEEEFHVCIPFGWYPHTPEFLISLVGALKSKKQIPKKIVLSFPLALLPGVDRLEQERLKEVPTRSPILPRKIEEGIVNFFQVLLPDTEVIVDLKPSIDARFDMLLTSEDCDKAEKERLQSKEFLASGGVLYKILDAGPSCEVIVHKDGEYVTSKIQYFQF